jgi:DNA-binding transcriptional MerR regulator
MNGTGVVPLDRRGPRGSAPTPSATTNGSACSPPPARSAAGYRLYDQDAVARLRLIKGAQRAGLRLREIGELLQVADQGLCPCGHTETLLRERLAEVRAELDRLRGLEAELTRLLEPQPLPACPEPRPVAAAAAWWCAPDRIDPCPPSEGR